MLLRLLGGSAIASVGPGGAQELLRVGAVLVDASEPGEWATRQAPNARHHPLGGLGRSMGLVPTDPTLVTACRSGERSAGAAEAPTTAGRDAGILTSGLMGSQAAPLPTLNDRGEKDQ
jgi:rhodanese-related sulfurtransferase